MRRLLLISPLIALLLQVATPAQVQRDRPLNSGTSAIRGTLIDAVSKEPIAGCTVRASEVSNNTPSGVLTARIRTGADGSYEFVGIAEGRYYLSTDCAEHLMSCLAPDAGERPCGTLTLFKDQRREGIDFQLTPGAKLRGRVVGVDGTPVAKATVRFGLPFTDRPITTALMPAATKDDGTFELRNLPEGAWRIEVEVPPTADAPRPPVIYYPGVLSREEASAVAVYAGKVTDKLTITVPRILSSTVTVHLPPPDATMSDVAVAIIRANPLMTRWLELDAEGKAVVKGLIEGRYVVMAMAKSGEHYWAAHQPIDFMDDSIDVSLNLQPTGKIRGRVIGDRGRTPPLENATVGAVWVEDDVVLNPLNPDEATIEVDGSFEITSQYGRRMIQLGRFDPQWRIESILYGKSDVTTSGIEVTPNATIELTVVVRPR